MLDTLNQTKAFPTFLYFGAGIFKKTISNLLNCETLIWTQNLEGLKSRYEIDITENPKRFAYIIDDDNVILSTKILENRSIVAIVPIVLIGAKVGKTNSKILNEIASTISHVFSDSYESSHKKCQILFGDHMIKMIIANCFSKPGFNTNNIYYLIAYLQKLSSTTLENRNFKTGFIITRSLYAYAGKNGNDRQGEILPLNQFYDFLQEPKPDKRFWYLVDGNKSFYICDHKLSIRNIFIRNNKQNSIDTFIDSYALSQTLLGKDVAFRIINNNQFSVICAEGIEFIYIENTWKLRDYNVIINFLNDRTQMDKKTVSYLLFYIFFCSHNNISSIMWIPNNINDELLSKLLLSYNSCLKKPLSIVNEDHQSLLKRIFSCDGVSIIDKNGTVSAFGCIVNLSEVEINKLIGTGESAAKLLAKEGIAIKISQDGGVKIYHEIDQSPLIF